MRLVQRLWLLLLLLPAVSFAEGFDQKVHQVVDPIASFLASWVFYSVQIMGAKVPLIVVWLVCAGLFFTWYFRFINLRGISHAIDLVRGKYDDPSSPGEVNRFQALMTAISGTVGIGNIGGVAVAISIGGPGATLWMMVAGFLAMSTKFAECTLAVKYRDKHEDGTVSGGPMYYLSKGLQDRGLSGLGALLGFLYAIGIVAGCLGGGNMFQANQAFEQFVYVTGGAASEFADKGWLFGLILAGLVGMVIIGGIKRIVQVTEKLVPFMAAWYLLAALVVIFTSVDALGFAVRAIWSGAFFPKSVAGGFLGALVIGFQRAVFSNEAGIGSAAIAHSAVKTDYPATEGFVSLLEPLIDTIIICTLTALVITIALYYDPSFTQTEGLKGVSMTSAAFAREISWFGYPLAVGVFMFALSTMIAWSYYGLKGWTYLFGEGPLTELVFKLIFCAFVVLGCMTKLGAVIDFSDAMIFVICIPNILGLYLLAPVLKLEVASYVEMLKSGKLKKF